MALRGLNWFHSLRSMSMFFFLLYSCYCIKRMVLGVVCSVYTSCYSTLLFGLHSAFVFLAGIMLFYFYYSIMLFMLCDVSLPLSPRQFATIDGLWAALWKRNVSCNENGIGSDVSTHIRARCNSMLWIFSICARLPLPMRTYAFYSLQRMLQSMHFSLLFSGIEIAWNEYSVIRSTERMSVICMERRAWRQTIWHAGSYWYWWMSKRRIWRRIGNIDIWLFGYECAHTMISNGGRRRWGVDILGEKAEDSWEEISVGEKHGRSAGYWQRLEASPLDYWCRRW